MSMDVDKDSSLFSLVLRAVQSIKILVIKRPPRKKSKILGGLKPDILSNLYS